MARESCPYLKHLQSLAVQHQIKVMEIEGGDRHLGCACVALRAMILPEIRDASSYAVALHEFGHFIAPYGNGISQGDLGDPNDPIHIRQCLTEEYAAWEWAQANAVEWTLEMEHTKILALGSYQNHLRELLGEQIGEAA